MEMPSASDPIAQEIKAVWKNRWCINPLGALKEIGMYATS
jgi:hypothetical protein